MSKGLEAFNRINNKSLHLSMHLQEGYEYQQDLETIERALKEHEQYKDIEEELGIDLYHIMEAILNGYYWKDIEGNICHFPELDFIRKDICDESPCRLNHYYWNHTGKYLEDYGKTWALTKEELK